MSVLSVSRDVLKYALALAGTPAGSAAVLGLGGPVAGLIVNFGLRPLAAVLDSVSTPEITEDQIHEQLAKGVRIEALKTDLTSLYGWDANGAPTP